MPPVTVAEYVLTRLSQLGIDRIVGVPEAMVDLAGVTIFSVFRGS